MSSLRYARNHAPTHPLRVCLALLAVNRRLSEIEDSIRGSILDTLPERLLTGPHGPRLVERIDGYARARAQFDWMVEEGWPGEQDRAWARRGVQRATRRLAGALVRALLAPRATDGNAADAGAGEAVRDPRAGAPPADDYVLVNG